MSIVDARIDRYAIWLVQSLAVDPFWRFSLLLIWVAEVGLPFSFFRRKNLQNKLDIRVHKWEKYIKSLKVRVFVLEKIIAKNWSSPCLYTGVCGCTKSRANQIQPRVSVIKGQSNSRRQNHSVFQGIMMAYHKPHTTANLQASTTRQNKTQKLLHFSYSTNIISRKEIVSRESHIAISIQLDDILV